MRQQRRAVLMAQALARHLPEGTTWTTPEGGFYIWLTGAEHQRKRHQVGRGHSGAASTLTPLAS